MTMRRSFLAWLGLAPVAAPAIAEELAKPQFATGGPISIKGFSRIGKELGPEAVLPLKRAVRLEIDSAPMERQLARISSLIRPLAQHPENTPTIRASHKRLPGLPERISRERAKSVRRA